MLLDKIFDVFMFREGTEEDIEGSSQPKITTGSIVWGMLARTAVLMLLSILLLERLELREYSMLMLFVIWLIAIYPGWRQWQHFQKKMKSFQEDTLCGSCVHFDPSSQLCKRYDEHPTKEYIPCEGADWEPIHYDSED